MFTFFHKFVKRIGPGFITGAADNDPSGIVTYTQVGAQFGLGQLWTAIWCFPFLAITQEMVARIGMVTGEGIIASLRKYHSKTLMWVFVILLFIANSLNIGADLGAMADAARLLIPRVPYVVLVIVFTLFTLILEIYIPYKKYADILKWFSISLLGYIITAFLVTTNWISAFHYALIPTISFDTKFMMGLVAVFGTTISPYLFVWQANQQVEEEVERGRTTLASRQGSTKKEIKAMQQDISWGMAISQFITVCIILTAASVFFTHGITNISTTAEAASALKPIAGNFSFLLFTIGIIGTGLLAIPVLSASASYALSDALCIETGLYKKLQQARGFYVIIAIATFVGITINFLGLEPIKVLYWTSVLNGLIMPILLAIIIVVANNRDAMGEWRNSRISNIMGIGTFIIMFVSAVLFISMSFLER